MLDYPNNFNDFLKRFPDEKSCYRYLEELRWSGQIHCPRCGHGKSWPRTHRPIRDCAKCRHQISLLAGTIFQDSHLPLQTWFHAIWWVTTQKSGFSALSLQRALGLGSYRTAWTLLHKLRVAMIRPDRNQLSREVEVDEIFLGGKNNKILLAVGAERDGKKTGRIRIEIIPDRSSKSLLSFIEQNIVKKSLVVTDGLNAYDCITNHGYLYRKPDRKPRFWEENSLDPESLLPRVHRIAILLRRWYYGTHHGRIETKYLKAYLDEFVFRFNRRTSASRGLLFLRTLQNSVKVKPKTYSTLISIR